MSIGPLNEANIGSSSDESMSVFPCLQHVTCCGSRIPLGFRGV